MEKISKRPEIIVGEKEIKPNMEIYNLLCNTPDIAKKEIKGGRLKGMTDINPMHRIKMLTEVFGACGFGWYYEITDKWLEQGADGVIAAFVNINLYVKYNGEWSKPIQGTGGSSYVAKEQKALYTDDEAYKKALTDAISVACKALGMCADVYYKKDFETKYTTLQELEYITKEQLEKFKELGITEEAACAYNKVSKVEEILKENAQRMISAKEERLKK